jgi:hypothetical protein
MKRLLLLITLLTSAMCSFAETGVTMVYNDLPLTHLFVLAGVIFFAFGLVIVLFICGFSIKWGNKELVIGYLKHLLSKKDGDIRKKEELKRFSDDIDNDVTAQLYDLVDDMDDRLKKLVAEEHCFFSFTEFIRLVQEALKKRIRRNNFKERMSDMSRERYVERILDSVRKRYEAFQYKTIGVKCGDTYKAFEAIEGAVKDEIKAFVHEAVDLLVIGMKKKIELYEAAKPEFKTADARKFCCDDCIVKNKVYIKNMTGEEV